MNFVTEGKNRQGLNYNEEQEEMKMRKKKEKEKYFKYGQYCH